MGTNYGGLATGMPALSHRKAGQENLDIKLLDHSPHDRLQSGQVNSRNFPKLPVLEALVLVRADHPYGLSALLLQHQPAVGVLKPLQLRQERQAEQVFREGFVGQHHGVDIAHHEPAEFDHGKARARRLDGAVGGRNRRVVMTSAATPTSAMTVLITATFE